MWFFNPKIFKILKISNVDLIKIKLVKKRVENIAIKLRN